MRKYSLIMPTLWLSDLTKDMLSDYRNSNFIDEIIIIDNYPAKKIKIDDNKFKYLDQEKNIYVNPAWNLGVKLARNNFIIFSNDDVHIKDIDSFFKKIDDMEYDLIGIDLRKSKYIKEIEIIKLEKDEKRKDGFGCFFIMRKENYIQIPEDIKIWYGDDIQYDGLKDKYIFSMPNINYTISKSVESSQEFRVIARTNDKVFYNRYLESLEKTKNS